MRILLTGGAGDLGQALVPRLIDRGDTPVVLDIRAPANSPSQAVFVPGSILDRPTLRTALQGCDAIVHIAAWHGIHEDRKDAYDFFDLNVRGTFEVLQTAASLGIRNVVFISTTSVFRAGSLYGRSKILAERIAADFATHDAMTVVTLRPRGFIPHWNRDVYTKFSDWARWFWGGAVHIDDVAAAVLLAVDLLSREPPKEHLVLTLDSAYEYTDADLAEWDAAGPGSTFRKHYAEHYDLAVSHGLDPAQKPRRLDIAETVHRLGYRPSYSLGCLLAELAAYGDSGPPRAGAASLTPHLPAGRLPGGTTGTAMQFGWLTLALSPSPDEDAIRIDQQIDLVRAAEAFGFHDAWLTEHYFTGESVYNDALLFASALAMRTTRIRIGFAVLQMPFHHPVRLAVQLALLDNLSKGRIDVGIGKGTVYNEYEFVGHGMRSDDSRARMAEAFEVLERAWRESPLVYEGQYFNVRVPELRPKPVQQPGPPIWRSVISPASFQECGRRAIPILTARLPVERIRERWALYEAGLAEGGHNTATRERLLAQAALWRNVYVAETDAQAEDELSALLLRTREHMMHVRHEYNPADFHIDPVMLNPWDQSRDR
ncbi:MAG: LLM class flavin-dependent oxidoreductase [Acetobacteraceae bacterium]